MTLLDAPPAPAAPTLHLPPAEARKPEDKIPGLEITWKDAEMLELADQAIIDILTLKDQYGKVTVIPTLDLTYVARSCTRLEWRKLISEIAEGDSTRDQLLKEGKSEAVAQQVVLMMQEDRLVEKFLLKPKLSLQDIRRLPPGDVKHLHDSIMMGLGYGLQPRAIRV